MNPRPWVRPVSDPIELQQAFDIRKVVFVQGQDCAPEEEFDDFEDQAEHLIGGVGQETMMTARWRVVQIDGETWAKLERFAVLPQWRGRGLGRNLVERTLERASRAGHERSVLYAQSHLQSFYEAFGFVAQGATFMEAGIPHVAMWRNRSRHASIDL